MAVCRILSYLVQGKKLINITQDFFGQRKIICLLREFDINELPDINRFEKLEAPGLKLSGFEKPKPKNQEMFTGFWAYPFIFIRVCFVLVYPIVQVWVIGS